MVREYWRTGQYITPLNHLAVALLQPLSLMAIKRTLKPAAIDGESVDIGEESAGEARSQTGKQDPIGRDIIQTGRRKLLYPLPTSDEKIAPESPKDDAEKPKAKGKKPKVKDEKPKKNAKKKPVLDNTMKIPAGVMSDSAKDQIQAFQGADELTKALRKRSKWEKEITRKIDHILDLV